MRHIIEPERRIAVRRRCGVLVAGGGFAGISAALAAAREGADVCLVEREWQLGGLGTLGLITIFLPLCDGMGHQVIRGIGEELLLLAVRQGLEDDHVAPPTPWMEGGSIEARAQTRYQAQYNPNHFALAAEALLRSAGVQILYGTLICAVASEGGRISHVVAEDKGGRFAIEADAVVDATGDADICHLAGAPVETFGQGNLLAAWHYANAQNGYHLRMLGVADVPDKYRTGREAKPLYTQRFTGLDGEELSQMTQLSHQTILHHLESTRAADPSYAVTSMATIPQIRMTRRLAGRYTLDDVQDHQSFPDSIGMTGDWRRRGPVYELPLGTLCCDAFTNLFCAGRCISVTDAMWDIARVIPTCTVTGQAAGTAAALLEHGPLRVEALQDRLRAGGVLLHLEDAL